MFFPTSGASGMTRWEEPHTWWTQEYHMNHNEKEHVCVAITLTLLIIRQIIAHVHNKWIVILNRIITSVEDPNEHTKEKNKLKENWLSSAVVSRDLSNSVVWKRVVEKEEAEQSKNYSQGRVLRTSILRVEPSSGQELRCLSFRQGHPQIHLWNSSDFRSSKLWLEFHWESGGPRS